MRRDPSSRPLLERWVRGAYDTASNEDLPGIARTNGDGTARSWHVTDEPDRVLRTLKARTNLVASFGPSGQRAELGPGFYVGNPRFWSGRATRKWDFLTTLTPAAYDRLADYLFAAVRRDRANGRITEPELARAERAIDGGYDNAPDLVGTLANLPYGIPFWRPDILEPLGIRPTAPPSVLAIDFRGHFIELTGNHPPPAVLRTLRRAGIQGVYTRAWMGTNAELVIWQPRAILSAQLDRDIV